MKSLGSGCLTLFGLPFLLAGLFVMYLGLSNFLIFRESASWVLVPALIEQVRIDVNEDSEGDTYAIKGSYTYQWEGRDFTGTRIVIDDGYSSFRGQIEAMKGTLEKHRVLRKPIEIRVNPKHPEQSLVYREISGTMMITPFFGLVFVLTGLGICGGGVLSVVNERGFARRKEGFPDKAWKWEGLWGGCRTTHDGFWPLLGSFGATLFGNSFIWVFVLAVWLDSEVPGFLAWGSIFLGCVGLCSFVLPYQSLRHYLRYGSPTLLFEQVPIPPGEILRAVLLVKSRLIPGEGVRATLRGNRLHEEKDDDGSTTVTTNFWTETLIIRENLSRRGGSSAIPIVFKIPGNLPGRDMNSEPRINWHLEVEVSEGDTPFRTTFELPVFPCSNPEQIEHRHGSEGVL